MFMIDNRGNKARKKSMILIFFGNTKFHLFCDMVMIIWRGWYAPPTIPHSTGVIQQAR
jgi:hypothetical protein